MHCPKNTFLAISTRSAPDLNEGRTHMFRVVRSLHDHHCYRIELESLVAIQLKSILGFLCVIKNLRFFSSHLLHSHKIKQDICNLNTSSAVLTDPVPEVVDISID